MIYSVLGIILGLAGLIFSFLTAKELRTIKQTNKLIYDDFRYLSKALNLYKLSKNRIVGCLTIWETHREVISFLQNTEIEEIIFYGCIHKGTMLTRVLKRFYLNKDRVEKGLKPIQIYAKKDFDVKLLITDTDILIAKKIDIAGQADLSVVYKDFYSFNSLMYKVFANEIMPNLIQFELFLKSLIDELSVKGASIELVAEKLLDGEDVDPAMSKTDYIKYLDYALSSINEPK